MTNSISSSYFTSTDTYELLKEKLEEAKELKEALTQDTEDDDSSTTSSSTTTDTDVVSLSDEAKEAISKMPPPPPPPPSDGAEMSEDDFLSEFADTFGDDAVDEITNEDGSIDFEKLKSYLEENDTEGTFMAPPPPPPADGANGVATISQTEISLTLTISDDDTTSNSINILT